MAAMVHLKIASDYLQGAVTCCRYIIWLFCCLFVRNMAIALDFGQLISSGIYIHIWILTKTNKGIQIEFQIGKKR